MANAKKWTALLLLLGLLASLLCGCVDQTASSDSVSLDEVLSLLDQEAASLPTGDGLTLLPADEPAAPAEASAPDENGSYTTKEDVCAYLIAYGHLPSNFITKDAARDKGWSGGGLDAVAGLEGKCIGGDRFGNAEGLLPKKSGRQYYECDIDTLHAKERGAKRIVYSNDGLIYYTGDHYETFELLWGNP